ncbi:MAG: S49 family peptidase [Fimbriimonadaceae bacterium]|nr:S49 family peptidase [Fimbriimonadaceae bacterium]
MPSKAALALAMDRVWCIDERYGLAQLEALRSVPGELMLGPRTLDEYALERVEVVFGGRAGGGMAHGGVHAFAVGAYQPRADDQRPYAIVEGVAFIELSGPLLQRPSSMSGGTSTIFARRQVRMAMVDDQVSEIVLLIDSPGGQSSGLGCLADDIRMAAQKKTTVAYLSSMCASAAYWVASQCSAIVASPYAQVGSIGVYTLLVDDVEKWAKDGYSLTLISSGGIKGKWATGQPVDDELVEDAQREVDAVFGDFVAAVARGRGISTAQVKSVGTGHCWRADEAIALGLVDATGTEDDVLSGLIAARAARS